MALTKISPDYDSTLSQAHPETMDVLSNTWCNFAVQAFEGDDCLIHERSLVLQDSSIKNEAIMPPAMEMEKMMMDDGDKFLPPWKSNDIKSWIWMQQALHPELNYNSSYFKKKWASSSWKFTPFNNIKKWLNEITQRKKEEQRLQKAQVHAAISVAGVAAALAAIAAENSKYDTKNTTKDSAIANAAALVAAQCTKMAEVMGAKRDQLTSVIGSATKGNTTASEIAMLTAVASTSLRGADTLEARSGCKSSPNGQLLLENNVEPDFNFEKDRLNLAKGANLTVEVADGRSVLRSVKVVLNNEAKVILKMKKLNILNALAGTRECVVLDLYAELYKDSKYGESGTGYLIVLKTDKGAVKLDMMNKCQQFRTWSMTINHMLMLSASFTKHKLQFYKK